MKRLGSGARRKHRPILSRLMLAVGALVAAGRAEAHFQEILPSRDIVEADGGGRLTIDLVFTHPMAGGPAMAMARPARFGVATARGIENLEPALAERVVDGQPAWQATYEIRTPGDHVFFVAPRPYWEPGEQTMIIHYAKVVVDGYGGGGGWDRMVGLPVEIRPLVRPYGLWTGNLFRGVVEKGGKPVPFAQIEVEWRNDGSLRPPADAFVTQVIRADANGTFAYAMPRAGWWGFAALIESDERLPGPDGRPVPVELGGLIWVRTTDMK